MVPELGRLPRALSSFNHVTHRWAAMPLRDPHQRPSSNPADAIGNQSLTLTSWNIQAWPGPLARSKFILDHILNGPNFSDIIHLQEVTPSVRQSILDDPRVRSGFLMTDAEDDTSFQRVPFATMTLLSDKRFGSPLLDEEWSSLMVDSVFRMELHSRCGRDALCVNIIDPAVPDAVVSLLNVHLESQKPHFRRSLQILALANLLREPKCRGGIIAGDFNAILAEDHRLVDELGLLDAWVALHGSTGSNGATWDVGVELRGGRKACRLDKVVMLGLKPDEIEVLQPGLFGPSRPWSDHCGLCCTFTI